MRPGATPGPAASSVSEVVSQQLGLGEVVEERFQGGSAWSSAYVLRTSTGRRLFAKTARGRSEDMFRGEALGLQALRGAGWCVCVWRGQCCRCKGQVRWAQPP